ncbi:Putative lipid-transfer protein DIR1 [Linum perenne]
MANLKHLFPFFYFFFFFFFFCLVVVAVVVMQLHTAMAADSSSDGNTSSPTTNCRIDPSQLNICRPAVTGTDPPPPSSECCKVVKTSNLPCLCRFKDFLPAFGIDPHHALALPKQCGLNTPPECLC